MGERSADFIAVQLCKWNCIRTGFVWKCFVWRLDFSGQRETEERERLLYIRLHIGLRLRALCQATGAQGAKGHLARTHGFMTPIYLPELLLLCSTSTDNSRNKTAPRFPPQRHIISASLHQEPKGPNFLNRRCVFIYKKNDRWGSECAAAADVTPVFCVVAASAGEEMPDWSVWSLCLPSQAFFLPSDVRAGAHE